MCNRLREFRLLNKPSRSASRLLKKFQPFENGRRAGVCTHHFLENNLSFRNIVQPEMFLRSPGFLIFWPVSTANEFYVNFNIFFLNIHTAIRFNIPPINTRTKILDKKAGLVMDRFLQKIS